MYVILAGSREGHQAMRIYSQSPSEEPPDGLMQGDYRRPSLLETLLGNVPADDLLLGDR